MDFFYSVILGIVEGVTEFLPISSTAHLRLAQYFMGISLEDEYWKLFAIFIQLGAILSVIVLYRGRIMDFLSTFRQTKSPLRHPIVLILLAFLCTAIPAFAMKKVIGHNLENLTVMVGAMFVGGVVMFLVEWFAKDPSTKSVEAMKPWQAIFIGLVQVTSAVFPGTSRSMSTIASAQIAGLSRPVALEFSFLLSIPVMIVATLYDLLKYVKEAKASGVSIALDMHQVLVLGVGFVVSFAVALGVVAWFLAYVQKRGFLPFAVYRVILAAVLFFLLKN